MKFLVTTPSTEMTKRYIDALLSFQILFISRVKFSYFIIFSVSVLGRLWVKGTAISITSAILFYQQAIYQYIIIIVVAVFVVVILNLFSYISY